MISANAINFEQTKSFLIGPLVLLTIFVTLLKSSGYPVLVPEVILALGVIIILGAALGFIVLVSPSFVRIGIYSCLMAMTANALFRPFPTFDWLAIDNWGYSLAIFCVFVVLLWKLGRKSDEILFVVFLVLLSSSFLIASRPSGWEWEVHDVAVDNDSNLPPYIHIVLDEHIGLEGVPKEFDPTEKFQKSIAKSYIDLGYKVYGNVIAPTPPQTLLSFQNFLNFVDEDAAKNTTALRDQGRNVLDGTNKLFSSLSAVGYQINVVQSAHLDLCQNFKADYHVKTCRTYPFSPLADSLMGSSLGTIGKATVIVDVLFQRTGIAVLFDKVAGSSIGQMVGFPRWPINVCIYCISAFTALTEFDESIREIKRGEAYFIHLMAPHGPYQFYNENCDMIFPFKFQVSSITNNFSRYLGQAACTQLRLSETLARLAKNQATRGAIIIIHGDHGPRAYSLNIEDAPFDPDSKDYGQAAYSTFFVARAPGLLPEYDPKPHNLFILLKDLIEFNVISQNTQ